MTTHKESTGCKYDISASSRTLAIPDGNAHGTRAVGAEMRLDMSAALQFLFMESKAVFDERFAGVSQHAPGLIGTIVTNNLLWDPYQKCGRGSPC